MSSSAVTPSAAAIPSLLRTGDIVRRRLQTPKAVKRAAGGAVACGVWEICAKLGAAGKGAARQQREKRVVPITPSMWRDGLIKLASDVRPRSPTAGGRQTAGMPTLV